MDDTVEICAVWIRASVPERGLMSADEFLELNTRRAKSLLSKGGVEFLDPKGRVVPPSKALSALGAQWIRRAGSVEPQCGTDAPGSPFSTPHPALERRQHTRRRLVEPVRVLRIDSGEETAAISQDLSTGGAKFRSRSGYRVGEQLLMAWPSSWSDDGSWERGTVIRTSCDPADQQSDFPRVTAVRFEPAAAA